MIDCYVIMLKHVVLSVVDEVSVGKVVVDEHVPVWQNFIVPLKIALLETHVVGLSAYEHEYV